MSAEWQQRWQRASVSSFKQENGLEREKVSVALTTNSMEEMRLALKRADFNTFSGETIRCLFEDSDFCDVTLVCSDAKQIRAHKVILSAGSEFFRSLLKQNNHNHPLIFLNMPHNFLLPLVSFVYLGGCEVEQDAIEGFLRTATILGVKGLMAEKGDVKSTNVEESHKKPFLPADNVFNPPMNKDLKSAGSDEEKEDAEPDEKDFLHSRFNGKENPTNLSNEVKTEVEESLKANDGKCDQCSYIGKSFWYLNRHRKAVHEGLKYSCELCTFKVTDQTVYNTHLREIHGLNKLLCNLCEFKANRRGELQAHMRDDHQPQTSNFQCNQCDHKATCEAFLNFHKNKAHQPCSNEETSTQETTDVETADDIQQKTVLKRQRIMDKFHKYVAKETGGKTLAHIVGSKDGREILFELVFCYLSKYRNDDGSGASKHTLECIRSNIKQSLLDQFALNIMEGSKAQTRWKNLVQG